MDTSFKAGVTLIGLGALAAIFGGVVWTLADYNETPSVRRMSHSPSWAAFGLAALLLLVGVRLIARSAEAGADSRVPRYRPSEDV